MTKIKCDIPECKNFKSNNSFLYCKDHIYKPMDIYNKNRILKNTRDHKKEVLKIIKDNSPLSKQDQIIADDYIKRFNLKIKEIKAIIPAYGHNFG